MLSPAGKDQELAKENALLRQRIQELENAESKRIQEEEELRSSRQLLRLLIDAGPDFFFLKDLNLRYQLVNLANAKFFGLDESEILGKTDFELMPAESAAACQESDHKAINEKQIVINLEPVGDKVYETYKFPVIDSGKVVGVAAIIRDITDRKRMEEELRESRQFLYDLIEHSGALICIKDRGGRYELVNSKWEEVTGIKRSDVIGRMDEELFPGATGKQFRINDAEIMNTGAVLEKEEILEDESGKRYFISIKFPLRGKDGAVSGMCGMITEITARKKAEEEREVLISELKNALSEIKTLSGMLPICSSCKKIRNDKGYWQQLEEYLCMHSEAEFSHGICPECARKLYPDLYEDKIL